MRPVLFAIPFALLTAAPVLAEEQAADAERAPVVRNADGSFTITETIEAAPEELDALPWETDRADMPADGSRRPRDEAEEAIEEAYEEAEDMARFEAGPD